MCFKAVDRRFDAVESRLDSLEARLPVLEKWQSLKSDKPIAKHFDQTFLKFDLREK